MSTSGNINIDTSGIEAQLAALSRAVAELIEAKMPPEKRRVISKQAKNLQHGDLLEFPGFGWGEINVWAHHTEAGEVTASAPCKPIMVFKDTERVRVKRVVPA